MSQAFEQLVIDFQPAAPQAPRGTADLDPHLTPTEVAIQQAMPDIVPMTTYAGHLLAALGHMSGANRSRGMVTLCAYSKGAQGLSSDTVSILMALPKVLPTKAVKHLARLGANFTMPLAWAIWPVVVN